jgi:outer membrane protein
MFARHLALATLCAAALGAASAAYADAPASAPAPTFEPEHAGLFMVNVRITDVIPTDGQTIWSHTTVTTGGSTGDPTTDSGLRTGISQSVVPTLGLTYFVTDSIAAELILGTSYHQISAVPAAGGASVAVRDQWVLPPTLSLQYHFLPKSQISPYLGVGPTLMLFYAGNNLNGFTTRLGNGFGLSLEAGADIDISQHASINLDLKKIFFSTDATINGGSLTSHVNLDPWVPSVGVGWKF